MALTDTSFQELTLAELKAAAESFAVDLNGKTKKADIISEIEKDGVTWQMYVAMFHAPEEEEEIIEEVVTEEPVVIEETVVEPVVEEVVVAEPALYVLKMIRKNHSYQIRGYEFTRDHPYALVREEDVDYLVDVDGGFRAATPKELKDFYGV